MSFLLFIAAIVTVLLVDHITGDNNNGTVLVSLIGTMWAVLTAYFFANVQQKNLLNKGK